MCGTSPVRVNFLAAPAMRGADRRQALGTRIDSCVFPFREIKMTKRATELIGKPVVAADTGEKLGTVSDLLLDGGSGNLIGLVLRHGLMKSEDVMPAAAIQTLGADAIVSRSKELIGAREWSQRTDSTAAATGPEHRPRAVER